MRPVAAVSVPSTYPVTDDAHVHSGDGRYLPKPIFGSVVGDLRAAYAQHAHAA